MKKTNFSSFADFPAQSKLVGGGRLLFRHGMAHGNAFERWFDEVLEGATFGSVRKKSANGVAPEWRLELIALHVTRRRPLVLPDDLLFYREPGAATLVDPHQFQISRAAPMSLSIPHLFHPIPLHDA